jgi:hypothetical protein
LTCKISWQQRIITILATTQIVVICCGVQLS